MNAGVEGRIAVVGGSSSGLGFAVAEVLAARGAKVMVVSRSAERVSAAVDAIREIGAGPAEGCVADFRDPEAPRRVVTTACEVFGPPEIVVANGGGPPGMPAEPLPGLVLSNALRAAVTGYLKSLADEVAADGVTVNTVCPGYTATDRLRVLAENVAEREGSSVDRVFEKWAQMAPVRRLLRPEEVAAAVTFLCSEEASGITGIALPVDGGFSRGLF